MAQQGFGWISQVLDIQRRRVVLKTLVGTKKNIEQNICWAGRAVPKICQNFELWRILNCLRLLWFLFGKDCGAVHLGIGGARLGAGGPTLTEGGQRWYGGDYLKEARGEGSLGTFWNLFEATRHFFPYSAEKGGRDGWGDMGLRD